MLFCFLPALLFLAVHGASTNYTIDDTNGDARTGAIPAYEPGNSTISYGEGWTENCEGCWVVPNSEEVFDGTWHHATDLHAGYTGLTISFAFTGTALYVYCIIPTYWGGANWFGTSAGSSTWTNMSFTLDGGLSGSYVYTPPMENTDTSSMQYNALVFAVEGLPNYEHQFIVEPVNGSIIMFDYAIYTFEDEISSLSATGSTAPSTPSTPPDGFTSLKTFRTFTVVEATTFSESSKHWYTSIISAVFGAAVLLGALFLVLFVYKYGRRFFRRHFLRRTSEEAPAGSQEGSNRIQGGASQIRDDVQLVLRENPTVTIPSPVSLLAQHPGSVDSAANLELQSNNMHLPQTDPKEPRQDISLGTSQSRRASFVSFSTDPLGIGSHDDIRSFPEGRISHERADHGDQN